MTSQPLPPKRIFPTSEVDARAAEHVPVNPADRERRLQARLPGHRVPAARGFAAGALPARADEARAVAQRSRHRLDLRLLRLGADSGAGHGRRADRRGDQRRAASDRRAAEGQVALITMSRASLRGWRAAAAATTKARGISWSARAADRRSWKRPTAARADEGQDIDRRSTSCSRTSRCPTATSPRTSASSSTISRLRKMHFLLRARAVAVFPGGYGTFDEMFELLTLIQTGKVRPLPILLFGRIIGTAWSISRRWSRKA